MVLLVLAFAVSVCCGGCESRSEEFLKAIEEENLREQDGSEEPGTAVAEQAETDAESESKELRTEPASEMQGQVHQSESPEEAAVLQDLYIDVEGAVVHPGVYVLKNGDRIFQAIEAAGGLLPEANVSRVNQAQLLADGQQIRIPLFSEEEPEESTDPVTDGTSGESSGKVNLNTATEAELCTLTGIGAAKARAILKYREDHGSFSSVEELMQVEGIKEGTFAKIKDEIAVR